MANRQLKVISLSILSFTVSSLFQSDCYVSPSCTATENYDKVTGFTNNTGYFFFSFFSLISFLLFISYSSNFSYFSYLGWDLNADLCCQICLPGTPPTVCFNNKDPECKSKTGNGDYDFLLLDQMWQPQFCASLKGGHDPTLTHLIGTECQDDAPKDLRIHGLWPNYFNGYPQCCNSTSSPSYTLNPSEVIEWDIYPQLQSAWAGVAPINTCSVCYMLNHEWLKHGGCYSPGDPIKYFTDSVGISNLVLDSTKIINSLGGAIVETSFLESLYPAQANILCDPHSSYNEETGKFLELRTCWTRELSPIDCPASSAGQFTAPCPKFTYIPKE